MSFQLLGESIGRIYQASLYHLSRGCMPVMGEIHVLEIGETENPEAQGLPCSRYENEGPIHVKPWLDAL